MRHGILECALGTVEIEHCIVDYVGSNYTVLLVEGWAPFHRDAKLPGGKFTAREFLERYLRSGYGEYQRTEFELGTFYFHPEAVEMAKVALEEWGTK